jgi:hypothetical protein
LDNGIMPWLFEWDEVKGHHFQKEIAEAVGTCRAGAIFLGDAGEGAWQMEEIELLVAETKNRPSFNVIPVVLPNTKSNPQFPGFVRNRGWVDFRRDDPDPLQDLIRAITGLLPSRPNRLQDLIRVITGLWSSRTL